MEKENENLINYRVNTLGKFSGSVLTVHIDCNLCIITPTDIYNTHIYTHTQKKANCTSFLPKRQN